METRRTMQIFDKHHWGDLTLNEDLQLRGLISGTVTVPDGIHLEVDGMIAGDLIVQQGGRATIRGMVNGIVQNDGGEVDIFGMVDSVRDLGEGKTRIDGGAVIRDQE